jgi:hypothetical protein
MSQRDFFMNKRCFFLISMLGISTIVTFGMKKPPKKKKKIEPEKTIQETTGINPDIEKMWEVLNKEREKLNIAPSPEQKKQ